MTDWGLPSPRSQASTARRKAAVAVAESIEVLTATVRDLTR
ncbi:hypothetical protein [Nocardia sp. NPDC004722]